MAYVDHADIRVSGYGLATLGLRGSIASAATTFAVNGLRPGKENTIYVGSRDGSRNVSPLKGVVVTMPVDKIKPTKVRRVRHRAVKRAHARIYWKKSTDNDEIAVYQVWLHTASRGWRRVATAQGTHTGVTVHRLKSGTKYRVRIRALDRSGNRSSRLSPIDTFTTRG
jgi:hypothetical protein